MKLATLGTDGRDGKLVVVDKDFSHGVTVPEIAGTLQAALDDWATLAPELASIYRLLNQGEQPRAFALDATAFAAPLPRAYQFLDGSAYSAHLARVRGASPETPAATLERQEPVLYQGCSHGFLGPREPLRAGGGDLGLDFEAEIAVVTDDVPVGVSAREAAGHIRLVMLINDVSLRRLIPDDLATGFGFLQGKPPSAAAPVAVTPAELGASWVDGRLRAHLAVSINDRPFAALETGEDMAFDFAALIAHAARTRPLCAGTIIGGGTVANRDAGRGFACILEKRALEKAETGRAATPFLAPGDRIRIEALDGRGRSLFGAIEQPVASGWRRSLEG